MNIGKNRPGSHTVRLAERAPDGPAGQAPRLRHRLAAADPHLVPADRRGHARSSTRLGAAGALQPATGGVGEHVVEAGGVELDVLDLHAGVAQGPQRGREGGRAAGEADGDGPGLAARSSPNASSTARASASASGATVTTRVWAPTAALSTDGLALPHDPAAVDDGDPPGQLVGLLEVLRGEEHRRALAR